MPYNWFKDCHILDFTNPEAVKWWFNKRRYLADEIGVDGFKTDGGEFVFGHDLQFHDGSTGREMRNLYPNLYVAAIMISSRSMPEMEALLSVVRVIRGRSGTRYTGQAMNVRPFKPSALP